MTDKERFDEWLSKCPVDYYEAFGPNTYMFLIPKEDDNESDGDSN